MIRDNLAGRRPGRGCRPWWWPAWARYAEGVDEYGEPIEVVDRRKDAVVERAKRQRDDPLAFLEDRDLFHDLHDQARFTEPYLEALGSLHDRGARDTLTRWLKN